MGGVREGEMTGSEILVRALEREGVRLLFAYPGATSMLVHHQLLKSSIRVVMPRHEQGGAFAANGYARRCGRPGVCIATSGPGATNLVTGITDACTDSIPMVIITCQVNQHLIGKNAFQETDIIGMTRPCVKHSYLVLKPEEIAETVKDAFWLAVAGRPGPVVIDIPTDVLRAVCVPEFPAEPMLRQYRQPALQPDVDDMDKLRELLRNCQRPCIYAGGGIISSGAAANLLRFAEAYRIPVATSLMGIGAFPEEHALSLKFLGMHGSCAANFAVHECDLLLALSVRFSDRVTGDIKRFAPMATIVHVDIDESEINKNKRADLAFVCDADRFLRELLNEPFLCGSEQWLSRVMAWKEAHPFRMPDASAGMSAPRVIARLGELTGNDATIVTGVGQHQMWAAQFYRYHRPRQLLVSGGLGAMGFGLPAAIGALLADNENGGASNVILLDGDGSFQMNIQELATVYAEQLPLKIIILNNQNLGMVYQWEERFLNGEHAHTDMRLPRAGRSYPDFCTIAKGYSIDGEEVREPAELDAAIGRMLAADGPYLLDIQIAHGDMVLPMIPAGKTCEDIIVQ